MKKIDNRVAVLILNYFGHEDCLACVKSVQGALNAQAFLVDNSADKREKAVIEKIFGDSLDVHMLFPRKNLGFAAGVNLAVHEAVSCGFDRFLILNNDAILLKRAGRVLNKAYKEHPGSLIAPAIRWGRRICRGNYYHKYLGFITEERFGERTGWLFYLTGCVLAFDRALLDKVGYFDESFFMYGEDVEYSFRAMEKGVPLILLEDELVLHKGSASAQMASFFYEYHVARSHYLLVFRILDNPLKQTLSLIGKSIALTARACIRCLRYHKLNPLIALLLAPIPLQIRPQRFQHNRFKKNLKMRKS
jgi:GT2 family glycosyltransferase